MGIASDDEDEAELEPGADGNLSINAMPKFSEFVPTPGGPFSALTPSMWPQDILHRLSNPVGVHLSLLELLKCAKKQRLD